jgi:F420-dependent oxidoreductase-like protein
MELGYHIANFSWDNGVAELGPTLARVVRDAEAVGIARLTVMDHLWQIGNYGPPEKEMLEAYTALGFIAANTSTVLLHTLVTGVVYREPGLLAKEVTTLDVLSGGRAGLGIGAAWNEAESHGLGLPFPPVAERFERLEEAIQIALQMWSDTDGPYEGKHYQLERTLNSPQSPSRPHPYLMVGGSGERKTLRLVAQYADACNIFAGPEAAHKLEVLRAHCVTVGRDYDEIEKTSILNVSPETTREALIGQLRQLGALGFTATYISSKHDNPFEAVELLGSVVEEAKAL